MGKPNKKGASGGKDAAKALKKAKATQKVERKETKKTKTSKATDAAGEDGQDLEAILEKVYLLPIFDKHVISSMNVSRCELSGKSHMQLLRKPLKDRRLVEPMQRSRLVPVEIISG